MSLFLILMIAGLFGMALMAIPAFGRHGHGLAIRSHGTPVGHIPGVQAHGAPLLPGSRAAGMTANPTGTMNSTNASNSLTRFLPSPRIVFSILAAYGAFGYALAESTALPVGLVYALALVPAILLERLALTPLWNFLLGFQGEPCTPVEHLVLSEAEALTPFRNGKGIVRVVHDGRDVQFSAQLTPDQARMPIRVGDKLRVEEVEPDGEHVKVSLI